VQAIESMPCRARSLTRALQSGGWCPTCSPASPLTYSNRLCVQGHSSPRGHRVFWGEEGTAGTRAAVAAVKHRQPPRLG
jgi:hypothetical protein